MNHPSSSYTRLVMLGAAPQTHGSIAAVVDAWRAQGLFRRWPIDYIATHAPGSLSPRLGVAARAMRDLVAAIARDRRLVVHVHAAANAGFWRDSLYLAAAAAARCPSILQLHGGRFERFYDRAGGPARELIRFLFERAACVVVPSESMLGWTRSVARRAHAVRIPSPAPAHSAGQAAAEPSSERGNLVLFLGRLEADKGVFDLVDALAAVRASIPDVRLVCAGEGDRGAVARHAERAGVSDAVKFTGWVGPSGKRVLLDSAAVFALPSYSESLPMGLLEAMAAGVPVVASPVGGVGEAVVDGVSGLLCAPGDTASLARALRKLLVDRAFAARLGAAARESVRLRFAAERSVARVGELYSALGLCALADAPAAHTGLKPAA